MIRNLFIITLFALCTLRAAAQTTDEKIAAQQRTIENLEKRIAAEEREIAQLKKGRTSAQERAKRLARQVDARNQLIDANEAEAKLLQGEIGRKAHLSDSLTTALEARREQYAEMVREAYRNHRHNNYLTYLFSAGDFREVARRITMLRSVATLRREQMEAIRTLTEQVASEQATLALRQRELDSVERSLTRQRDRLQRDAKAARTEVNSLTKKEKAALKQKVAEEQKLQVAIDELRRLTRGNREGASFSNKTSNLRLPVVGGSVKRYKGNMAEVSGPKGAAVLSIYEGKVVDVKRNRITNKYDVYVAHGEYISSYANLNSVCVTADQKVARNERIGTIGSSVDVMTMATEYRILFGIYGPTPNEVLKAENCFKK